MRDKEKNVLKSIVIRELKNLTQVTGQLFFAKPAKNNKLTVIYWRYIPFEIMPNTKSAIRRVRRVKKQTQINRIRKSKYKSALKEMNDLIEKKDNSKIKNFLPKFQSILMQVAKTGTINKKTAARKISRVSKKIAK